MPGENIGEANSAPTPPIFTASGNDMLYYESRRGENWNKQEVQILTEWIHISATFLDILSEACERYRKTLRANTIINLVFSTIASTISVSTFNLSEESNAGTALALKITFTCMTMILTIAAGYIKVYQIQEKLENSLRLKNEWALFGSKISSEMQLPLMLRTNGIALVNKMKDTYLQLVQSDLGIRKDIIKRMAARSGLTTDDLTLSEIFERIAGKELDRIHSNDYYQPIMLTMKDDMNMNDLNKTIILENIQAIIEEKPAARAVQEPEQESKETDVENTNQNNKDNIIVEGIKDIFNIGKSKSLRATPIKERARISSFIQKSSSSSRPRPSVSAIERVIQEKKQRMAELNNRRSSISSVVTSTDSLSGSQTTVEIN